MMLDNAGIQFEAAIVEKKVQPIPVIEAEQTCRASADRAGKPRHRQTFVLTGARGDEVSRALTSRAIAAGAWSGNGATELTLISHKT